MPNKQTHRPIGLTVGAVVALQQASGSIRDQILETLAGAGGGWIGAALPDWLDPPCLGPRHRGAAHGILTAGSALIAMSKWSIESRGYLRSRSAEHTALAASAQLPLRAAFHLIVAASYRAMPGFLSGLAAGYCSHLALDAVTPAGLPLMSRRI